MKDLPHHMKKLNRQVIRSEKREMTEELTLLPSPVKRPKEQIRKQAKAVMKKERDEHVPIHLTKEERNWEMKHRVPMFDRLNHPTNKQGARASKKKVPRI